MSRSSGVRSTSRKQVSQSHYGVGYSDPASVLSFGDFSTYGNLSDPNASYYFPNVAPMVNGAHGGYPVTSAPIQQGLAMPSYSGFDASIPMPTTSSSSARHQSTSQYPNAHVTYAAPSGYSQTSYKADKPETESWEPPDLHEIGYQDENNEWRCKHAACVSLKSFNRACDLRKHFRGHEKNFFCQYIDCPRFSIGFSSRKDCQRHEASHNPAIKCEAKGCDRVFSRIGQCNSSSRIQSLLILMRR